MATIARSHRLPTANTTRASTIKDGTASSGQDGEGSGSAGRREQIPVGQAAQARPRWNVLELLLLVCNAEAVGHDMITPANLPVFCFQRLYCKT